METEKLKILHLEDSETDIGYIHRLLEQGNLNFISRVVDAREDYIEALTGFKPDVVISDHSMPAFNSMEALEILRTSGHDIPFILLTGAVSEEFAAQIMMKGADDYILKDRPLRLPSSIINALDKYHARQTNEKSEAHLRNIFNGSLDVLCSIDTEGRFVMVSAAAQTVWGYNPDELIGRKYMDLVFEDDHAKTVKTAEGITLGVIETNFENRYIHKGGWLVPMVWSARWDNEVNIMYCVARDGTEKQEAESKLKNLANRLQLATTSGEMGTWVWEIKNNILSWDKAMYSLYNISKDQFGSVYDSWFSMIHPEDRASIENEMSQALKSEKKYDTTFRILCDDLSIRYIRATGLIEKDEFDNPVRMIGLNWDITDRKNAENEIKELNSNLEKRIRERTIELNAANLELEAFNYTVSHDLQAPLRVVSGFVELLQEEYNFKLDDTGKEYLDYISKNTDAMHRLIRNLLDFSKIGGKQIAKADVDFNGIVKSIVSETRYIDPKHSVEIHVHDLGSAFCDFTLIKQVWMNLISNAIKYSKKKGEPVVEIGTTLINGIKTYYVKDNGAGFDMKYYNNLFGIFKRLHSDEDFEGTGIGLTTVHRIITKHGGKVWAEGKLNEGAIFYFTLSDK